jgi:hypothetical protein
MAITVYTPAIQVTLYKVVQRTAATDGAAARYTGAQRTLDLTPYLGDAGAVRTAKALSEAAGGFSIVFADKTDPTIQDTAYAAIEPMDGIEIRAARSPNLYAGGKLPLIMRGYVSSVRRAESVDAEGNPQRSVIVQGQDAGALWLLNNLYFMLATLPVAQGGTKDYLSIFQLNAVTGIAPQLYPVNQFMQTFVDQVVNPRVRMLDIVSSNQFPPFAVAASVPDGAVYPQQGINLDAMSLWQAASMFADRPWNEFFIQDLEAGPQLVFRPTPYRDLTGNYIMNGATDPGTIDLDISAVVSLDVMRSNARVANFWWVPVGNSSLLTNSLANLNALQKGEPLETGYENNDPNLYGVRRMEAASNLLPTSIGAIPGMLPPFEQSAGAGDVTQWNINRATQLKLMNHDNSALEEGTALVQGNENLAIGKYLHLTRGSLVADYYIERVAHSFSPMKTWTTNLVLVRGTGFVNRIKSTGSASAAEKRKGPYTTP